MLRLTDGGRGRILSRFGKCQFGHKGNDPTPALDPLAEDGENPLFFLFGQHGGSRQDSYLRVRLPLLIDYLS